MIIYVLLFIVWFVVVVVMFLFFFIVMVFYGKFVCVGWGLFIDGNVGWAT